jgi:hypothetical protein
MSGVSCYFGVTTSGKTTLALDHLIADVNRDGRPSLVLDCMPARNLRDYPHARSVDQVVDRLYGKGTHAFFTPASEEDLAKLFGAVHAAGIAGGPVHVLWDEASLHQSPQHIDDRIAQAVRGWQHNDCSIRIVTQRPADLNGVVFATMPEVFCFRLERQADLDRVREELRLDPAVIEKLNQGQSEFYSRDRFKTVKEQSNVDQKRVGAPKDPGADAHAVHAGEVQRPADPVPGPLPQDLAPGGGVPAADPGRNAR